MRCGNKLTDGCGAPVTDYEHALVQSIRLSTVPICYDCFKRHVISLCDQCGANVYGVDHAMYTMGFIDSSPCSSCFKNNYLVPCKGSHKHEQLVRGCDIVNRLELYGILYVKCDGCYSRAYVARCECGMDIKGDELDRAYEQSLMIKCLRCCKR